MELEMMGEAISVQRAKAETILDVVGRPVEDQLRLEALNSYSIMGNPEIVERKDAFLFRGDDDRPRRS